MKSPPVQYTDEEAKNMVEAFASEPGVPQGTGLLDLREA
jgi:hypothetical protein